MKWKIGHLEEEGIVYMATSGPAGWDDIRKMCEGALAIGRRNGSHRFLVDHRNLKHGLSILQVDKLPEMLKEIGVTPQDKLAILLDPASPISDTFSFFRDVSFIESLQVKNFTDQKEALVWLKSER